MVNHKTSVMSFSYLRWHPSFDRPYMHTFCGNVNRASSIPHLFISSASCFWYSWPSRKIAAVFILMGVSLLWNSNPHLEQACCFFAKVNLQWHVNFYDCSKYISTGYWYLSRNYYERLISQSLFENVRIIVWRYSIILRVIRKQTVWIIWTCMRIFYKCRSFYKMTIQIESIKDWSMTY